jgi:hypothetical protein
MKPKFLRRANTKLGLWFKKKFSPKDCSEISKTERDAMIIFNTLVNDPGSELFIHPANTKFYIKSAKTGIFLTMSSSVANEISIINHVYGYNVKTSDRVIKNLTKIFLAEVEKRRMDMENEYLGNIEHSIHTIAKTIKERL